MNRAVSNPSARNAIVASTDCVISQLVNECYVVNYTLTSIKDDYELLYNVLIFATNIR